MKPEIRMIVTSLLFFSALLLGDLSHEYWDKPDSMTCGRGGTFGYGFCDDGGGPHLLGICLLGATIVVAVLFLYLIYKTLYRQGADSFK